MNRAVVYSHDTYGLGNIRRMLAISRHLIENLPDLSVLLITGSPMIHGFKLPPRLDYIKLPCLSRTEREKYSSKYLGLGDWEIMKLRMTLVEDAITAFGPDLVLVDKKPFGINNELSGILRQLRRQRPRTNLVLILRDILDSPPATIKAWKEKGFFKALGLYDKVLVLGLPEVFDVCTEYRFPANAADKVRYCGYTRREGAVRNRTEVRREFGAGDEEKLVLVTTGGGEDGASLVKTYLAAESLLGAGRGIKSLIIDGPEIPETEREQIHLEAARHPLVVVRDFTDDMLSLMNAADLVVSMGGYNTTCEILTLEKRAIVVPRVAPVEEQRIRTERMARLGLFKAIYPDRLWAGNLAWAVLSELNAKDEARRSAQVDLDALPRITEYVRSVLMAREEVTYGDTVAALTVGHARDGEFIETPRSAPPVGVGLP